MGILWQVQGMLESTQSRIYIYIHNQRKTEKKNASHWNLEEDRSVLFNQSSAGKFIPRALLIDLSPDTIEPIQNSALSNLFDHDNFVVYKGQSGFVLLFCIFLYLFGNVFFIAKPKKKHTQNKNK